MSSNGIIIQKKRMDLFDDNLKIDFRFFNQSSLYWPKSESK